MDAREGDTGVPLYVSASAAMGEAGTMPDRWGYPVRTTSDACIAAINSYYHQVLAYGRNRAVVLEAPAHDPACVLANVLAAHYLSGGSPSEACIYLDAASSQLEGATSYERAVFRAVSSMLDGKVDGDVTIRSHSELLKEFPKDLASLKRVQILCFYLGRPDISLSLVEQVLPYNQSESYIYGMLAFPMLELGRMEDAEIAARKGLKIDRHDFWSQHAICHVYQNDCRFKEAVEFMEECSPAWISCSSFMYTHNWWHIAVCYLEGHAPLEKVLNVYDYCIMKELEKNDAERGEVYLNALGLLLRIFVRGHFGDIEERVKILVDAFTNKSNWHREWLLDILALWALTIMKNMHEAKDLIDSMQSRLYQTSNERKHSMQRGILLAEALYEYGKGNDQKVFHLLGPEFDACDYKMIGASDEQLDVFNEVWYGVLLNTGHGSKLIEVLESRIKQREGAPFLWHMLEKAYSIEGMPESAHVAERRKVLEAAYF